MSLIRFGATPEDTGRALVLAAGLLQGPSSNERLDRPFGASFGICGAGLFGDQGRARPAIFLNAADEPQSLFSHPASDFIGIDDALGLAFPEGRDWLMDNLRIVPVGPCIKHANTTQAIVAGGVPGRLGAPVQWGAKRGYLTAGHVGQNVGKIVVDAQGQIGSIVYADDPQPGRSTAEIDIALVECNPGVAVNNGLGISNVGTARSNDYVVAYAQTRLVKTAVLAYCKWFTATISNVTFADVYLSANAITAPGDSGGPVVMASNPQQIIGHVVAGGKSTSCFQDIKPQMARLRSNPQFAALTI